MRVVPDNDGQQWRRVLDERSVREAAELIPRPGQPIYGLAAPVVRPVTLAASQQFNDEWIQLTVAYGPWDARVGPYVRVTTAVTAPDFMTSDGMHGLDPEAELRQAVRDEAARPSALPAPGGAAAEPDEAAAPDAPPAVTSELLPAGPALVARQGTIWAARLTAPGTGDDGTAAVVVTIVGRDVVPEDVRVETLTDLREAIEGRNAELARIIAERRRQPPPPPPPLEPAEGVEALRALADFTLGTRPRGPSEPRAADDGPGRPPDWGAMYGALWRRAVLELQRVAGMDATAADAVVTSAVNHLGGLAENAPWFTAAERLRAAAIDETLRHAMFGDEVRSEAAQRAWAAFWSRHLLEAGRPPDPDRIWELHESRLALESAWLAAWEAWTRDA